MSILKDRNHKARIKAVAYETAMKPLAIERAIELAFEYMRHKLSCNDLPEDRLVSEEEFDKLLPTIKVPGLGYFKPSYYKYVQIYNNKQKKKEKNGNK